MLGLLDLTRLAAASRACKDHVQAFLPYYFVVRNSSPALKGPGRDLSQTVERSCVRCSECGARTTRRNPFTGAARCVLHMDVLITRTNARSDFKLTDEDLNRLDYTRYYCRVYRTYVTLFQPTDVIQVALLKYRQTSLKALREFLLNSSRRRESAASRKRASQLERAVAKAGVSMESARCLEIVREFLGNGAHGIRAVSKVLRQHA